MEFSLKRGILEKIQITDEVKDKLSIKENPEDSRITWDYQADLDNPLEIEFSQQEKQLFKRGIEALVENSYDDDFWRTAEKIYDYCTSKT
jgi:hypothetical protein